jgi:hypothetical protein
LRLFAVLGRGASRGRPARDRAEAAHEATLSRREFMEGGAGDDVRAAYEVLAALS